MAKSKHGAGALSGYSAMTAQNLTAKDVASGTGVAIINKSLRG